MENKSNSNKSIKISDHYMNTPEWEELSDEYAKGPEPHYMNTSEWRELVDKYSHIPKPN
jgi:hypothetical protein